MNPKCGSLSLKKSPGQVDACWVGTPRNTRSWVERGACNISVTACLESPICYPNFLLSILRDQSLPSTGNCLSLILGKSALQAGIPYCTSQVTSVICTNQINPLYNAGGGPGRIPSSIP